MSAIRPARLIQAGAGLILSGFLYDLALAGLPFQDPTPAMQADWRFHGQVAGWIRLAGAAILCAGCLWGAGRWIGGRRGRG